MSGELVLVDVISNGATVRERITLEGGRRSFTIGRSLKSDVVLDDAHAAALHATVDVSSDGRLTVRDAGTANGITIAGRRQHDTVLLPPGQAELQIGRTTVRIRTEHDALAPELSDLGTLANLGRNAGMVAAGAGAICVGQTVYDQWANAPRDLIGALPNGLMYPAAAACAWIGLWALFSRIVRGDWHWPKHAAILLGFAAVAGVISGLFSLGSFALSLPPWTNQGRWTILAAACAALGLHLYNASNLRLARAALAGVSAFAILGGGGAWLEARDAARNVNTINARVPIYPDSLRVRAAASVEALFKAADGLKAQADERRRSTRAEDGEGGHGLF